MSAYHTDLWIRPTGNYDVSKVRMYVDECNILEDQL